MTWTVGVDIGGTFTDIALLAPDQACRLWKEDSTPEEPERAVVQGLKNVAAQLDLDLHDFMSDVTLLVHGSTIALNTVITRRGPRVGLVCTSGFRDVLYFRDGFKWDRYNERLPRPKDFVDRNLRLPVRERINSAGDIVRPLLDEDVRAVARVFRALRVEAIAVALLWSVVNPEHEQRVSAIMSEELPGIPIVASNEILPEMREWQRTSATVLSAYVLPRMADYLERLERWLADAGFCQPLLLFQNNGGCARVEQTIKIPVTVLGSGPAAAPSAAAHVGQRIGSSDLVVIDMGGTSFDVCMIRGGEAERSRDIQIEHAPIGVPAVEIHSIGAGGGSIAWIDDGGALRVGPRSAGSHPGPACYGLGGSDATVTDANLLLGYLSPTSFLGGRRQLDVAQAERVIGQIADQLASPVERAAAGIISVVDAAMVDAIALISVERGIDPRGYALLAGGGAGAQHAGRLAGQLGIRRVVIPAEAGALCAYGMAVSHVRHDYSRAHHAFTNRLDLDAVNQMISELETRARKDLEEAGFGDETIDLHRFVDARYPSQTHELTIPVPGPHRLGSDDLRSMETEFHEEHARRFAYSLPALPVEILHWRVTGLGRTVDRSEVPFDESADGSPEAARAGVRHAYFQELGGFVETPVFAHDRVPARAAIEGPAIVDSATTTVVVCPNQRLIAGHGGSFLLFLDQGAEDTERFGSGREPTTSLRGRVP